MNKLLAILLAAIVACASDRSTAQTANDAFALHAEDGRRFMQVLLAEISAADQVFVREHSFELDLYDPQSGTSLIDDPIVYENREIDAAQRKELVDLLSSADLKTEMSASLCIFAAHHSVVFYTAGAESSRLEICFGCGEVRWIKANYLPPAGLVQALSTFVTSIGLKPERDWAKLAKAHIGRGNRLD